MSKLIKVEDQVYHDLDRLRVGRQTFSEVIKRMLADRLKIFELLSVLEGQLNYLEWKQTRIDPMIKARAERADLDARTL